MKILSLTYEYPPIGGGGGAVAAALNESLAARGDQVRVVTSGMPGLAAYERLRGAAVYRARCWRRHRHLTTFPELLTTLTPTYRLACRLIETERPDLIHCHFVLPSGWIARRLARRFAIPYVLTAHGSDIPGYNPDRFALLHRLLSPFWRRIIRDAAAVTSPSRFLAGLISDRIVRPVQVIPNGYAPESDGSRRKRNMVLVVARLFPRKGVEHFIDAVQELRTDWELVVAGDGPALAALKARAGGNNGNVRFVGFVDRTTLRALYEQSRIMVFPSLRENFPMVLLEAMDAGCAVITTDAEGCNEVVGDAGLVVPRGDPAGIRAALQTLMENPQRCRDLSRRARARVELFRWPRLCTLYRTCFERAAQTSAWEWPIAATETADETKSDPASAPGSWRTTSEPDREPALHENDGYRSN